MIQFFVNLFTMQRNRDDRGASAVEYGLLVGGIAAVIVVLVFALGGQISSKFQTTCTSVKNNGVAGTAC